jgi:hypothetical protein
MYDANSMAKKGVAMKKGAMHDQSAGAPGPHTESKSSLGRGFTESTNYPMDRSGAGDRGQEVPKISGRNNSTFTG